MKYKAGDKVRVIGDLEWDDSRFQTCGVTEEMQELSGKIVTIEFASGENRYWICEDNNKYEWREGMFAAIAEFQLCDLESGMVVEVRNGGRYLVLKDRDDIRLMHASGSTYLGGSHDNNLEYYDKNFDVMKVFDKVRVFLDVKTTTDLLWERKESNKMTLSDVCKQLGYDVEIIPEESR